MTQPPIEPPTDPTPPAERGFPADTPISAMSAEQQAAYWKFYSRAHERRSEEQAAQLAQAEQWRKDSEELKKLREANQTETEKLIAAAREETAANVRKEMTGAMAELLVKAEFKAAAAGKLTPEQIKGMTETLNPAAFLTDKGQPDEAKIQSFVSQFAPKTVEPPAPTNGFTNPLGQGHAEPVAGDAFAQGAAIAAQMFPQAKTK